MRHNGKAILVSALEIYGSENEKDAAALREACGALRSVTLGDDMRQDFSGLALAPSMLFSSIFLMCIRKHTHIGTHIHKSDPTQRSQFDSRYAFFFFFANRDRRLKSKTYDTVAALVLSAHSGALNSPKSAVVLKLSNQKRLYNI